MGGLPATELASYGAERTDTPAIDALATESVIFERAYTHSPQTLPSHASILTGQLPPEHGVRDEAGFTLAPSARTLAELLRSRGFTTGAAVSSFLLRPQSGLSQGFSFFDAEIPTPTADEAPALEREGALTVDAAERWIQMRDGQRFFLFVQVDGRDADTAVARLSAALKQHRLYDEATILLVGDHGEAGSGMSLDETALRIPLIVKQPNGEGAGRRVVAPVQHIDLLPTILDLVRAPEPGGLRGRSLRRVLDDDEAVLAAQPIYAESFAAYFRFGGTPLYALTGDHYRYVRGVDEELVALAPPVDEASGGESTEAGRLRSALDRMLASATVTAAGAAAGRRRGALRPARIPQRVSAGGVRRDDARCDGAEGRRSMRTARRRFSSARRSTRPASARCRRSFTRTRRSPPSTTSSARCCCAWDVWMKRFAPSTPFASCVPTRPPARWPWPTR